MFNLINKNYYHFLLEGNELATHDLEGKCLGASLGQDISTKESIPNGYYNTIYLIINMVKYNGSIKKFCEEENIKSSIIYGLIKINIHFAQTGSIRDDGPLPEVIGNVYDAQNVMIDHLRGVTFVI